MPPARFHDEILAMTRQGMRAADIAARLGVCQSTVHKVREKTGNQVRTMRPFTADEIAQAEQMLDDGCSYNEVGRTLGRQGHVIAKRWPGRGWSRHDSATYGALMRYHGRNVLK